jgi:D-cysteine desulfhydrase
MQLSRFPRQRYTAGATPIERLDRLSGLLGGPEIWIKRDDLLGLAAGGNKTRKLEFLVADAIARGADTLITVGAVQSNHCRLTLAAAVKEGLKCRLVLEQRVAGSYDPTASGNNFLFDLLGVEDVTVVNLGDDLEAAMAKVARDLEAQGRKGYVIPGGGSNALGALGYVACAQEIVGQGFDMDLAFDHLVCASGSAGTHAGLLVGLHAANAQLPITGVNVRRPRAEQEGNVFALAERTATLLGVEAPAKTEVTCLDDWVGGGYSIPTGEMVEAVRMLAQTEGVLLDPVYTGKAMAGLIGLIRAGKFKRGERVLFLHTGGSPALYAYQPVLASQAASATK